MVVGIQYWYIPRFRERTFNEQNASINDPMALPTNPDQTIAVGRGHGRQGGYGNKGGGGTVGWLSVGRAPGTSGGALETPPRSRGRWSDAYGREAERDVWAIHATRKFTNSKARGSLFSVSKSNNDFLKRVRS